MSFTDEEIARIAHAANRELQLVLGDEQVPASWDQASDHDKELSVAGVRIGRHGASPEVLHEKWVTEKQAAGWAFGDVEDAEAKTSPLLVPFDQLSPVDRAKGYLFAGICTAMNQASDVKTRAENDQRALAEALALVNQQPGANTNLPFAGAAPVAIDAAARRPAQAPEA